MVNDIANVGVVKTVDETAENFFSSVRTRSAIEPDFRYNKKPALDCVPPQLEMDYSVILNKPYFIKNIPWVNTAVAGTALTTINIPNDILTNPLVKIPFDASLLYRAKISVVLQVAGTPMHSGLLVAAATPAGTDNFAQVLSPADLFNLNKFMAAPHVFLSANEATPVVLEVPFYVNTKLAAVATDGTSVVPSQYAGNYAEVTLMVVNPMGVPTSGTNALTITAHFMFRELEFYGPHVNPTWVPQGFVESAKGFVTNVFDRVTSGTKTTISDAYDLITGTRAQMFDFVDSARAYLRSLTGLHNPADGTITTKMAVQERQNANVVDAPLQIEKMDPYSQFSHYTRDYTFDTAIDEMLVSEIASKPMHVGTFSVKSTNTEGTIVFSRPITPFQQVTPFVLTNIVPTATYCFNSLIQTLHHMSKYWRGGLKLHIQSAMSNFHYCKLTVARNYSPDRNMVNSVPSFNSVPNLMMETLEFSGHQVHTIDLPYVSPLEQLPCSTDFEFNALQHGMYYIYVHQPLVVNGAVPTSVQFNVYISAGEDFQLFGYNTRPLMVSLYSSESPISRGMVVTEEDVIKSVTDKIEGVDGAPDFKYPNLGDEVLYKMEAEVEEQDGVLLQEHEQVMVKPTDLRPIVSVRDHMRRWTRAFYQRFTSQDMANFRGALQFDVAHLIGVKSPRITPDGPFGVTTALPVNTAKLINQMFLGYSGGARFKISVVGTTLGELYYVPPGFHSYNTDIVGGRAWRSTAPFPELTNAPLNSAYRAAIDATYQYAEFQTNPQVNGVLLAQTVCQDKPNYVVSSTTTDVSLSAGANADRMLMGVHTYEIEVPHMTPYRFVGNSSKGYYPAANNYSFNNGDNSMGYLVLKVAEPVQYVPTVAPILPSIAVEIFSCCDDVGRAGYQVFAPTVIMPSIRQDGTAPNFNCYQIGPDSILNQFAAGGGYPGLLSAPTQTSTSTVGPYDYTRALYKTVN